MDQNIVETVKNWSSEKYTANQQLANQIEVQDYLGYSNHYQWYIPPYSGPAEPLTRVTTDSLLLRSEKYPQPPFKSMLSAWWIALVLCQFESDRQVIVKRKVPNLISAGV